ncbi:MAG: conjugal transfer protein TraF [Proteobacteria bacterium]|nr:conjugal transfer protein TraF [Pseudomonadota bacterium]
MTAYGDEPEHLRLSIRALGMGNAFVALANDENALFYNPAGLQSVQNHIFELVTVNMTASRQTLDLYDLEESKRTAEFGNMVGNKIYFEMNGGGFNLTAPGWGYSLFGGGVFDALINNPVVPFFELKAYIQQGIIGGIAWDFLDERLNFGVSLKSVTRTGISKTVHIVDFLSDEFSDELDEEFVERNRLSQDIGFVYHYDRIYNLGIRLAYVMKNIGGMDFGGAGVVPMSMDVGLATESELLGLDVVVAADYVDFTNNTTRYKSLLRNLKLGAEIGWNKLTNGHHTLSWRVGLNGSYPSFGFSINIPYFPLKIDYAEWSEEIGYVAGEIEDKRKSFQLSFNF